MSQKADHAVFDGKTNQLRCNHCGKTEAVTLPIQIDEFCKITKKFMKAHNTCQPTGIDSEGGAHD